MTDVADGEESPLAVVMAITCRNPHLLCLAAVCLNPYIFTHWDDFHTHEKTQAAFSRLKTNWRWSKSCWLNDGSDLNWCVHFVFLTLSRILLQCLQDVHVCKPKLTQPNRRRQTTCRVKDCVKVFSYINPTECLQAQDRVKELSAVFNQWPVVSSALTRFVFAREGQANESRDWCTFFQMCL